MSSDRRQFLRIAGAAGIAGLAGCTSGGGGSGGTSGNGSNGSGGNGSGNGTSGGSSGSNANIGMVYAKGGLGDKSFNDMANRGVKRAKKKLGISYNQAQPEQNSDFPTFQRRYAKSTDPNYDLVSCIGFAQVSALSDVAPNFPDQSFLLVDGVVDEPNVANYVFKEHEGSFQIGHLAGLLTTKKMNAGGGKTNPDNAKLGFVGGEEAPLIKKFQAGFEKGVKYANKDASVNVAYTGSFSDPGAGKEAAVSMYNDGADIVYHAAGATGIGVFQAASEQNRYALGVDSDQSKSSPKFANVILASMVKQVDNAVFTAIKNVVNDNFKGGNTKTLGLEKNGVEVVYGKQLGSAIPKEVKQALKKSRKKIISGEIKVPKKPGSGS
jgi:basic membrane protein A